MMRTWSVWIALTMVIIHSAVAKPETNARSAGVEIVTVKPYAMACVKHVSVKPVSDAEKHILTWAGKRRIALGSGQRVLGFSDLLQGPKDGYVFCLPTVEDAEGVLRIRAAETLPLGEVTIRQIEGGEYVTVTPQPTMQQAWKTFRPLCDDWLKQNGYEYQDGVRQCFDVRVPRTNDLAALAAMSPDERWVGYSVLVPVGKKKADVGVRKEGKMWRLDDLECTPRQVTNLACIEGCLRYLGSDLSPGFLYAGTGWAWIMHVGRDCCPSGPHSWLIHEVVPRRAKWLGIDMDGVGCYNWTFTEFPKNARSFARRAIRSGVPCFTWHYEYLLVTAMGDGAYRLTWPWGATDITGTGDGNLPFDRLGDSPREEIYSVRLGPRASDREIIKRSLEFAVACSRSKEGWTEHIDSTFAAYDNWIGGLESEEKLDWVGVGYHAGIWSECRRFAVEFLKEADESTDAGLDELFAGAISDYATVRDNLAEVARLFPTPNVPPGVDTTAIRAQLKEYGKDRKRRDKAAAYLRKARAAEAAGIEKLAQIAGRL